MGNDHSGVYLFTGNFPVKIADHGEYHFQNLREEPSVVAEEHPQAFGKPSEPPAPGKVKTNCRCGRRSRTSSFRCSAKRSVLFWLQEGLVTRFARCSHQVRTHWRASGGTDKTPCRRKGGSNRDRIPDYCSGCGLYLAGNRRR